MTDLTDRLAAIGRECAELAEYENYVGSSDGWMCYRLSDAALSALVTIAEEQAAEQTDLAFLVQVTEKQAEKAKLHWKRETANACHLSREIDKLEAENERLRVCGNCEHMRAEEFCRCNHPDLDTWDEQHYVGPSDRCEFTPSRWQPREGAGPDA